MTRMYEVVALVPVVAVAEVVVNSPEQEFVSSSVVMKRLWMG
jgi:hypothetical protein